MQENQFTTARKFKAAHLRRSLIAIAILMLILDSAFSQPAFNLDTRDRLPAFSERVKAFTMVDLNGDGDPDLFASAATGATSRDMLLLNDGSYFFDNSSENRLPRYYSHAGVKGVSATKHAVGDIDNDGDLDIVVARTSDIRDTSSVGGGGERTRILINDGSGFFADETEARLPFFLANSLVAVLFDVNGDSHLDLFIGNEKNGPFPERRQNRLFINDGTGHFTDETETRLPARQVHTVSAVPVDLDEDGDLDLYVVNISGFTDELLFNDSTGNFTDVTSDHLPNEEKGSHDAIFRDIDGDGDLDLLVTWEAEPIYNISVLINDGKLNFTQENSNRFPPVSNAGSLEVEDFDLDGDFDVLIGSFSSLPRLYLNDGNGFFTDVSDQSFTANPSGDAFGLSAQALDIDNDSDLDIIARWAGAPHAALYINDTITGISDEPTANLPHDMILHQNYPNPFNAQTRIAYTLNEPGHINLQIFDVQGRLVVQLVDEKQFDGDHEVVWDGTNERGFNVSSGFYLARLTLQSRSSVIQMILVK